MDSSIHFLSRLLPHFTVDECSYDSDGGSGDGGDDVAVEFIVVHFYADYVPPYVPKRELWQMWIQPSSTGLEAQKPKPNHRQKWDSSPLAQRRLKPKLKPGQFRFDAQDPAHKPMPS